MNEKLNVAVSELPEVYQPIFGHPEFDNIASRKCHDRWLEIDKFYTAICDDKKRSLRILDLGCAQGFFSLSLAAKGALVTGIDYSPHNIKVCNLLSSENYKYNVTFVEGCVQDIINSLEVGEYDLVLGLSVFHHLIYEFGLEYVNNLFNKLCQSIPNGIFEFALSEEPLYWGPSLPENSRTLIEKYKFKFQCSNLYGTHLSQIDRPLYIVSNDYWMLNDNFGLIDDYSNQSHDNVGGYHKNTRDYIYSGEYLIKIFDISDIEENDVSERNKDELTCEYKYLKNESKLNPKFNDDGSQCWLIRDIIKGDLLSRVDISKYDYNTRKNIVLEILEQITDLENRGLYHNDLRKWNIILDNDLKPNLIDYGSISNQTKDGNNKYEQILSFISLAYDILESTDSFSSSRPNFIFSYYFKDKLRIGLDQMFTVPPERWTFSKLYDFWCKDLNSKTKVTTDNIINGNIDMATSILYNTLSWKGNANYHNLRDKIEAISLKIDYIDKSIFQKLTLKNIEHQDNSEQIINERLFRLEERISTIEAQSSSMNEKLDYVINMVNHINHDIPSSINDKMDYMINHVNNHNRSYNIKEKISYKLSVVKFKIKVYLKILLKHVILFILNKPKLVNKIKNVSFKFPKIYVFLRKVGMRIKYNKVNSHPVCSFNESTEDVLNVDNVNNINESLNVNKSKKSKKQTPLEKHIKLD